MLCIGYEIQYCHDELSASEVLYRKRVIVSSWDVALQRAEQLALSQSLQHGDSVVISRIRTDSEQTCRKEGFIVGFELQEHRRIVGEVLIFSTYSDL
jgi:hypothetical protein